MACLSQGLWPLFKNGVPEALCGSFIPFSVRREKHLQSLAFPALSPTLDESYTRRKATIPSGIAPFIVGNN